MRVNVRFVWGAFVGCCFECGRVLELVVCRVRFARVSCPWLRFGPGSPMLPPVSFYWFVRFLCLSLAGSVRFARVSCLWLRF